VNPEKQQKTRETRETGDCYASALEPRVAGLRPALQCGVLLSFESPPCSRSSCLVAGIGLPQIERTELSLHKATSLLRRLECDDGELILEAGLQLVVARDREVALRLDDEEAR
jgi:hypothetical protein